MRKERVFKFMGKWYRWRYEDMSAKLITAIGLIVCCLGAFWLYMFFVVVSAFWGAW